MKLSMRRLLALCQKESYQIVRDPSSILIAFIMPMVLLFIFGYGVNLDADGLRIGLVIQDSSAQASGFEQALKASPSIELHSGTALPVMLHHLERGAVRGVVVVPPDFSSKLALGKAAVQVLTDGAEPNTANFVASYVQAVFINWQASISKNPAQKQLAMIDVQARYWFNPSAVSRNFLVPGSISVVMTIIGALLTSLVVAREWERGTMEALLATPVTRAELLLSKILPYYLLGIAAMLLCLAVAVFIMGVPFRGNLLVLLFMTSLFLGCALGMGLFLSTVMRNQFNAAQAALTAAFLPALMLSGFIYEIASMPRALQWLTTIIPARYFASTLQTLFQAGAVWPVLIHNAISMLLLMTFWLGLTVLKTRRTLD